MNWLTNFIRPKIRSIVEQKEVPDNFWQKCPACADMLFHRDVKEKLNVCSHCGYHMYISVSERLATLFDEGQYKELPLPRVPYDPLKFKDRKKYSDRLRESRSKTHRDDALVIAQGTIGNMNAVIAAFDFSFMGGSMGAAVGEGIVAAAEMAVHKNAAFIVIPSSGGARMQEGMVSLMQMPRTIIAAEMVKEAKLPYIVILTDPTTGGVSASFAMVGDIHIAEPGCTIGFAGKRVIQETIREDLPDDFQTAEYLLTHGMVDMVVSRSEMRGTLIRILDLVFNKTKKSETKKYGGHDDSGRGGAKKGNARKSQAGINAQGLVAIKTKSSIKPPANTNKSRASKAADR
ncbi:MAG: acetyl-CoA carboxylase carboxyl transferase subunit beta [Alphaproteobacteria bacterium CG_4_9_14_3_um_filter_47_13]|nr:MAG: acetyl-CoA carboxylase carboxyl transferase subunit beta [Alphaproteobacteria bacterium CG_4_9_14_3_um_filter_47_13]